MVNGPDRAAPQRGAPPWHVAVIERFVCEVGEPEEQRRRKVQFVQFAVLVSPAGLIWGALYRAFGEPIVGLIPTAYAMLTAADLVLLATTRRFELFRYIQQTLILVLPLSLQVALGGFVGSSAVILWAFLAVISATLFGGAGEAAAWFAAFVVAAVLAGVVQPATAITNVLPRALIQALFVLNVVTVSGIAFAVLSSFLADRRKLRALEVAYLNKEMMLRQSEKLATLGTLAAGMAHELNNPVAATRRAAEQLQHRLLASPLDAPESGDATDAVAQELGTRVRQRLAAPAKDDPLAHSDREAEIEEWLTARGAGERSELATSLADLGLGTGELARLESAAAPGALLAKLERAAETLRLATLTADIHRSSARVSDIVGALKSYTLLGQAPIVKVDLRAALESTLALLRPRIPASVEVASHFEDDLPRVDAYGAELNQVWTNILANAIDAVGASGRIAVRARRDGPRAVVEIEDSGPGIAPAVLSRIFDPFFTTKPPGSGAGLGLSTSHAIVHGKHGGSIAVESCPGRTVFRVSLPIERQAGTA